MRTAARKTTVADERPEDELHGNDALSAMHDALLDITGEPRVKFGNVKDIEVKKAGRWVLITVKHKGTDTNELTFRIGRAWAGVLKNRLLAALEG